jgi:hypothetical protein
MMPSCFGYLGLVYVDASLNSETPMQDTLHLSIKYPPAMPRLKRAPIKINSVLSDFSISFVPRLAETHVVGWVKGQLK